MDRWKTLVITSRRQVIMLKRTFDIVGSALGLLLTLPLLLAIAVWIKLDSRGPIVYRGRRVGRFAKPFFMLKLRTMVADGENIGPSSTSEDDPRITRAGRFLRKYKVDELPQLFNVLSGTMSFVGPRPQVQWAVDLYSAQERHLLDVQPGITDYACLVYRNEGEILKGSADPDKDYLEKIAPGKIRLGLEYVRSHSLWVDIKIILATILALCGIDPNWCLPPSGRSLIVGQVRDPNC